MEGLKVKREGTGRKGHKEGNENKDEQEDAEKINRSQKRFGIFWKMTEEAKGYTPFGKGHNETTRQHEPLHIMLDLLRHSNPQMRLACRSWLAESKKAFNRIIDPLLSESMEQVGEERMYRSFTGQLFFVGNYHADHVRNNFDKMKDIILSLNPQDGFLRYLVTQPMTKTVRDLYRGQKLSPLFDGVPAGVSQLVNPAWAGGYIQGFACITLQYIMGQSFDQEGDQDQNSRNKGKTAAVNASACEFMELLLKSVQEYRALSTELSHLLIEPLVETLKQAIINNNSALQVHLVHLLKVLFEGNTFFYADMAKDPKKKDFIDHTKKIFAYHAPSQGKLIANGRANLAECIQEGLASSDSFVRSAFIDFSNNFMTVAFDILGGVKEKDKEDLVLVKHFEAFIIAYTTQLGKVQIKGKEAHSTLKTKGTAKAASRVTQDESDFVISQELGIKQLLDGLKQMLLYYKEIRDAQLHLTSADNLESAEAELVQALMGTEHA
jgi:hypothetical protein